MKMKRRLFLTKSKKKKQNGADSVVTDLAPQNSGSDIVPSTDENQTKNLSKKKLRFRKHKSKTPKPTENETASVATVLVSPNGTDVVLRRNVNVKANRGPELTTGNRRMLEKRIPGSVSSSRTASSASSSSSARWSSRRPWSLADSLQAQSLSEFEELVDNSEISDNSTEVKPVRSARPLSTVDILPRNASIEEPFTNDQPSSHSKFALDLQFLRRFKRSSYSVKSDKQEADTETLQGANNERLSFRQKKHKHWKKNRRSWHEPSQFYAVYASPESAELPGTKISDKVVKRSDTDPSSYNEVKQTIAEDECQETQPPAPSHIELRNSVSLCSNSSASTVVSASELSKQSSARRSLTKQISNRSSGGHGSCNEREDGLCEKCRKRRDGFRRSVCYCYFATPGICAVDDDPAAPQSTTTSLIQDEVDGFDIPTSPLRLALDDRTDLPASDSGYSKLKKTMPLGGSLINLSASTSDKWSEEESTLTRQSVRNSAFLLQASKYSAVYASSPQLCDESIKVNSKLKKDKKAMLSRDNPTVDSPIKRAIGFPSVVLRRHHRLKKANESNLSKSSSGDLLSREQRAKQVISLNMEDLPTYNMMRDADEETNRLSEGRELSRTAILYQRYLSHATSFDDFSTIEVLSENGDALLSLYAAREQASAAMGHEGDRSSQNQVLR